MSAPFTIGILVNPDFRHRLASANHLAEAVERTGHQVAWYDPNKLAVIADGGRTGVFCAGEDVVADGVIRWMSWVNAPLVDAAIEVLTRAGVPFLNAPVATSASADKWATALALSRFGIPHPATALVRTSAELFRMADILGFPCIVKRPTGFGGNGVQMATSPEELSAALVKLRSDETETPLIIQRFVPEAAGRDLRVVVVGNQVVDAYERRAAVPGEFRSNVMRGGKRIETDIDRSEATTAAAALRAVGLDWGGVDLARTRRGPLVIEVNSTPGFGQRPPEVADAIGDAVVALLLERISA